MKFKGLTLIAADRCAAFQAEDRAKPSFFNLSSIQTQLHCDLDTFTQAQFELARGWLERPIPHEQIQSYPNITAINELE